MNALLSLYDALVSINVPADKAKAVVDAMERDASFLLATNADIALVQRSVESMGELFRRDMARLASALTIRLGSMLVVGLGVMLTASRALQH